MRRRSPTELWTAALALMTPRRAVFLIALVAACFTVDPFLRYFWDHPYFSVRRIEVEGLARLDPARVRTWLGMVVGRSMWRVSPRDVETQLEERPEVMDARVRRIFPDRLVVTIRERRPEALLNAADGIFLVDREGVVIGRAGEDVGDLPIISLTAGDPALAERQLAEAVGVASLLESGAAGLPISELAVRHVDGAPELVAYSDGGRLTLRLGWGGWAEKLAALSRVVAHEGSRGETPRRVASLVGVVDVRDPRAVTARWAASGSA
jgi:cell division protein FtsQ